jgi:MFS family permease
LHKSNALVKNPLRSVLTTYIKPTLLCSIISIFETVAFNILFVLSTTYQLDIIQRPGSQVIYGNLLILTSTALTIYLIGKFKKIERPYYHLLLSILMMLICIFPLFYGLLHQDPILYFASQSCLGILLGSFLSPFPYVLAKMFPTYVRCSGIAISYNITIAIFGGTAPLISLLLYQKTHWIYIPAAYIFVAGSISLLTLILGRKYFLACIEQHHLN